MRFQPSIRAVKSSNVKKYEMFILNKHRVKSVSLSMKKLYEVQKLVANHHLLSKYYSKFKISSKIQDYSKKSHDLSQKSAKNFILSLFKNEKSQKGQRSTYLDNTF